MRLRNITRLSHYQFPVISILILLTGCDGRGSVHIVPIGGQTLNASSPLVIKASPDECYFWVNDDKELCTAMRKTAGWILGKQHEHKFILSLVLKGSPAEPGRHYRLNRYSARMKGQDGFVYTRAASLAGEVVIFDYGMKRLRGRFRMITKYQTYSVLTGWRGNSRALIVGEFDARRSLHAGKKILAQTQEEDMERTHS